MKMAQVRAIALLLQMGVIRVVMAYSLVALPVEAATLQGTVVGVSDGDTITVLDADRVAHKIRLAGIDAPEKSQPFGSRSKQRLSDMVFAKRVDVDWSKIDRYGRTIGKVLVSGIDANLNQIRAGMAWHYKAYEKEQSSEDRGKYARAEAEARSRKTGLWRDASPIPPWDFRHGISAPSNKGSAETNDHCPCGGQFPCAGPRGGQYCIAPGGRKTYRQAAR